MTVNVSLWLYGKPEWDLPIEDYDLNPEIFIEQGDYLQKHLYNVANIFKKLKSAGWCCSMALYTLEFYNDSIKTEKQAKAELRKLGIKERDVNLIEFEDDEEYIEE